MRDIIAIIEADGWYLVAIQGDHRQYKHKTKKGHVTVPGKLSSDVAPGILGSIYKQAQMAKGRKKITMRDIIIIEKAANNFSAYCPDLPGCIAVGDTIEETKQNMREAIAFHLEGIIEDGDPIPQPSDAAWIDVPLAS